jgi:hypothetical protein
MKTDARPRHLDWHPVPIWCPCDRTRVVLCSFCGQVLLLTSVLPACQHAKNVMKAP